jgi:Flp pilus assembly protein TadD
VTPAPTLADRLYAQLASLAPGRQVTAAELGGWLAVSEDPAAVAAELESLRAARLASATAGKGRKILWALP